MSNLLLRAHPDTPCPWIDTATVAVSRAASGRLTCRFVLNGDIERLRVPPASAVPVRADGLWRHTCFELFIRAPQEAAYAEFNFSPSGNWAAYQFDRYRHGMRQLDCAAPALAYNRDAGRCILTAELGLPGGGAGPLQFAAAAVLEEQQGGICYWALQHPQGAPDFHHDAGFAAQA